MGHWNVPLSDEVPKLNMGLLLGLRDNGTLDDLGPFTIDGRKEDSAGVLEGFFDDEEAGFRDAEF